MNFFDYTYFLYYIKKRVKHFYNNNLGIHRVIIYFTVCLCIMKINKVIFQRKFIACSFLVIVVKDERKNV